MLRSQLPAFGRLRPLPELCRDALHKLTALVVFAFAATCHISPHLSANAAELASRPNVLIILCDDLGYGDLGCYGSPIIRTPNLDRLAAESMRFTDCHSAGANCSPSRTGMMTGRTPYRVGTYNWIPEESPMHLRASEVTIASLLQNSGYATAHIGKWHLNGMFNSPQQPQPGDHGFDYWFSTQNNADPTHHNPDSFARNGEWVGQLEGYSSTIIADEAIGWLERRDPQQPFFMYLCFHAPHEPIATSETFVNMYAEVEDPLAQIYYGNVSEMDHETGRVLQRLDELGLRDTTFVFFTSDNGPAFRVKHPYGSPGPLRGMKGSLYEGGHRVAGMIRWPGHVAPGSTSDATINGTDVLPTLCALAGIEPPRDRVLDGANFLPALRGEPIERSVPLYWQYNRSHDKPKVALRVGDWKLLATLTGEELGPAYGDRPGDIEIQKRAELAEFELYNLREDLAEEHDLASSEPERLAEMVRQMTGLYDEIRGEGPLWPPFQRPTQPRARP